MTKILNLDDLQDTTDKALIFKGVTHNFAPFTVEAFIAQMKKAEAQDKRTDVPASEYVEYMVELVTRSFPTVDADVLRKEPLDRLKLISDFVNDIGQEENEAAPKAAAKNSKGKSR